METVILMGKRWQLEMESYVSEHKTIRRYCVLDSCCNVSKISKSSILKLEKWFSMSLNDLLFLSKELKF